jgi:hypothetical protein
MPERSSSKFTRDTMMTMDLPSGAIGGTGDGDDFLKVAQLYLSSLSFRPTRLAQVAPLEFIEVYLRE